MANVAARPATLEFLIPEFDSYLLLLTYLVLSLPFPTGSLEALMLYDMGMFYEGGHCLGVRQWGSWP